jgi:hypothetical protein
LFGVVVAALAVAALVVAAALLVMAAAPVVAAPPGGAMPTVSPDAARTRAVRQALTRTGFMAAPEQA